ncbi:MAG TPA: hypothetical protein VEW08_13255 [Steroidobacteraceae bacterium]|nr:hypothetical protein [Steroidobacteraceae bacterium]
MNLNEDRVDHHRAMIIGTIAAVHFLLSVALFFLMMASGMSRFEGRGPSDLTHHLLNSAFEIWTFPLVTGFRLLEIANTGIWGWLVFLGNSALWGWVGWRAIRFWRSRHGVAPENL